MGPLLLELSQRQETKVNPYDDDSAWYAIKAAQEWQENAELAIDPEIMQDLIDELRAWIRPEDDDEETTNGSDDSGGSQ